MKSIVNHIIYRIAHYQERPERCIKDRILDHYDILEKSLGEQKIEDHKQTHRKNQSVSKLK